MEGIESFSVLAKVAFQFECPFGKFVYDLALFEKKLFIEFDAAGHGGGIEGKIDKLKEEYARINGWEVVRIKTQTHTVFNPAILKDVLLN